MIRKQEQTECQKSSVGQGQIITVCNAKKGERIIYIVDIKEALKRFSQRNSRLRVMFQKDYSGRNVEGGLGMENNGDPKTN